MYACRVSASVSVPRRISMHGSMTTFVEPASHKDMLTVVGRIVDAHLQDDRSSLDLSELLRVPLHCENTRCSVITNNLCLLVRPNNNMSVSYTSMKCQIFTPTREIISNLFIETEWLYGQFR